jgi:hypothetical protein
MRENLMSGSMRGGWRGALALDQSPTLPRHVVRAGGNTMLPLGRDSCRKCHGVLA